MPIFVDVFNLLQAHGSDCYVTALIQHLAFYTCDDVIIQCFINYAFSTILSITDPNYFLLARPGFFRFALYSNIVIQLV
jgi:hypothetical protein